MLGYQEWKNWKVELSCLFSKRRAICSIILQQEEIIDSKNRELNTQKEKLNITLMQLKVKEVKKVVDGDVADKGDKKEEVIPGGGMYKVQLPIVVL